jgi:hypothetical protein
MTVSNPALIFGRFLTPGRGERFTAEPGKRYDAVSKPVLSLPRQRHIE